jgi:ATP-dependent helicase YprA (DUF1998 family)
MLRVQQQHDLDEPQLDMAATAPKQVLLPGASAPAPRAPRSRTKRRRDDVVDLAKQDEAMVSSAWRAGFDPSCTPLPPHAQVLGVACLCGQPDTAEDYPGSQAAGRPVDYADGVSSSTSSASSSAAQSARSGTADSTCTFESVERYLQGLPWYVDQIKHVHHIAARTPKFQDTTTALHPSVRMAMQARGIEKLYAHQSYAIDAALAGKHVVISTSTSSGKSLVFSAPVFDTLLRDKEAVAMFIFPTKALAQDQLRALGEFLLGSPLLAKAVRPMVFDGDTPSCDREQARNRANLLLCNPDILHATLLPQHRRWRRVFGHLRYVVLDESHSYRGVFGTHVAMVLRRLVRLCSRYASHPVFFCCSATIANPAEHFRQLVPDPESPAIPAISRASGMPDPAAHSDPECAGEFRFGHTTALGVLASSALPRRQPLAASSASAAATHTPPFTESFTAPSTGIPTRFEDHGAFVVVSQDTSASGRRKFIVWNPPFLEDLMRKNAAEAEEWGGRGLADAKLSLREQRKADRARARLAKASAQKPKLRPGRALGLPKQASAGSPSAQVSPGGVIDDDDDDDDEEDEEQQQGRGCEDDDGDDDGEAAMPDADKGARDDKRMTVEAATLEEELASGNADGRRPKSHSGMMSAQWRQGSGAELLRAELAAKLTGAATAAKSATEVAGPSPGKAKRALARKGAMYQGQFRDRSRSAARGWSSIAGGKASHGVATLARLGAEARLEWPVGTPWPAATQAELEAAATALGSPAIEDAGAESASVGVGRTVAPDAPAGMAVPPQPGWAKSLLDQRMDPAKSRKSALVEASALLAALVEGGMRTLMFCRVRRVAELTLQYAHERLSARSPHLIRKVKSYRAGYLKSQRRAIESQLFSGELMGVVATNALELGVDIGSLDCVVLLGYPGSAASLWQQAGRAGRGARDAVAIMVTFDSPTEQYWVRRPEAMVTKLPEAALVDTSNPNVLRSHAVCAACEAPLAPWDLRVFGAELGTVLADLRSHGVLTKTPKGRDAEFGALGMQAMQAVASDSASVASSAAAAASEVVPRARAYMRASWVQDPQHNVSLRAMGDSRVLVVDAGDGNRVVDDIEYGKAIWEAYEGAIYMNQGVTYKIVKLDLTRGIASARVTNEQYYTDSREFTDLNVLSRSRTALDGRTHFGRVQSVTKVYGYRKVWKKSGKLLDVCDLSMPPYQFTSHGMWTDVPLAMKLYLDAHGMDFIGGCHAAAHALLAALPMFVLCDRGDIGTDCANPLAERSRPLRIAIFDKRPGGIGIAAAAFQRAQSIYRRALEILETCSCRLGCPSCCHDMACSGYNYVIDKPASIILLRGVLGVYPPGFQAYGGPALLQAAALHKQAAVESAASSATESSAV